MNASLLWPALYVLLMWWGLTGIVLYLDGLPRRTYTRTLAAAGMLLVLAFAGVLETRAADEVAAVYCAFTCALFIWGFLELSYLTGWITGPRSEPCPQGLGTWQRFRLALQTSLYHELLVVFTGLLLWWLTAGYPNTAAFYGFAVLWLMRWSAKLNAFFGVRNLNENWLPDHLRYLSTYMQRRAMNPFFPVSVAAAIVVAVYLAGQVALPADGPAVAQVLVLTLLVLAIIEHALLVLPFDASTPWRWGFRSHERNRR